MKTISVIIPMYNAEAFIRQSIQSVTSQTYQNLEILVVDDGSADRGPEICRELCLSDDRIQFYGREHMGVSAARNYALDIARGEYVFFLDSDDMIHPLLLEEMVVQMEKYQAVVGVCACERADTAGLELIVSGISAQDERPGWKLLEGQAVEEWFHVRECGVMGAIGGKMIRTDRIKGMRFDESLSNGEDTWFLYPLFAGQVCTVFSIRKWYYYRINPSSVMHSAAVLRGERYFEAARRIRDIEYAKGHFEYALQWQSCIAEGLEKGYFRLKKLKDRESCRKYQMMAKLEKRHPLTSRLPLEERLLFSGLFLNVLLFRMERKFFRSYKKLKRRMAMDRTGSKAGILTFHCADNFGAMLQAYGLKTYLCNNGIQTDVIRYEPPFMTGRHWMIRYDPGRWKKGIRKAAGYLRRDFRIQWKGRKTFWARRKNMLSFRETYLVDTGCPKLLFCHRLKMLSYEYYIVGSDQIWNPELTYGLRKAYFGAFQGRKKKKVISYAASLGGASLAAEYDEDFSRFIKYVDAVSVREEEAVPYVKRFYAGDVTAVSDPVFLLRKEEWRKLEILPQRQGYILVYVTQRNQDLYDYVRRLSQEKGLSVVELSVDRLTAQSRPSVDFTAGPSEFLGYMAQAEYVVSNSFHAIAFSIIYEKKFLAFTHSSRGARIENILRIHGLEDRLWGNGMAAEIDSPVDWKAVKRKTGEYAGRSGEFLINRLLD